MHYVNIAAAIDTLAKAEQHANRLHRVLHAESRPAMIAFRRESVTEQDAFAAGISFAIGRMLDPDTAAIIEAAAKERAQEITQ